MMRGAGLIPRRVGLGAAAMLCAALVGCQDPYLARRDTLTLGSGDAVQANIARHVIDPWSAASRQVGGETSGERAQHAMERYRNPGSGGSVNGLPPVPVGPAGAPSLGGGSGFR